MATRRDIHALGVSAKIFSLARTIRAIRAQLLPAVTGRDFTKTRDQAAIRRVSEERRSVRPASTGRPHRPAPLGESRLCRSSGRVKCSPREARRVPLASRPMIDSWLGRFASFQKNFPGFQRWSLLRYNSNQSITEVHWLGGGLHRISTKVLYYYYIYAMLHTPYWTVASWKVGAVCACSGFF